MSRVVPIPDSIKTTELSNTLTPIVANKKSKLPTVSNIKSKLPTVPKPTVSNIKSKLPTVPKPTVSNIISKLPTVSNIKSKLPNLPTVSNIKKFAGNLGLDTVSKFHDGIISNILSRIIIISISFIIFEKLLEEKKKKIKLFINGNNNIKTKLLEVIYKEFWYLPCIILVYQLLIIIVVYTIFFSIYMVIGNMSQTGNDNDCGNSNDYLFNIDILKELVFIFFLTFIANLIILILIYYILVVLSNENVSLDNKITDEFLDKFYSYYRFSYYSIILFLFIYISIS